VVALVKHIEMGFKLVNLKQCLALSGAALLMVAIGQEKKLPAATSRSRFTSPHLTYARMDLPNPATNSGFLDNINLSLDPSMKIRASDLNDANLDLQRDLPPGNFDQLQPRPGDTTPRALTVADRKLNYQVLGSGGFAFKVNLAPAYPYPQASIPTGLDPGFGISLKF